MNACGYTWSFWLCARKATLGNLLISYWASAMLRETTAPRTCAGPKILTENINAERRVGDLAEKFIALRTAARFRLIRGAQLQYLQIGVGSEASCMLNPEVCWVANTRTIWTHLVIKHADDFAKANEELKLYQTRMSHPSALSKVSAHSPRACRQHDTDCGRGERRAKRKHKSGRNQISMGGRNRKRAV